MQLIYLDVGLIDINLSCLMGGRLMKRLSLPPEHTLSDCQLRAGLMNLIGHVILVAITDATILVTFLIAKSLHLIQYFRPLDVLKRLDNMGGYQDGDISNGHLVKCPLSLFANELMLMETMEKELIDCCNYTRQKDSKTLPFLQDFPWLLYHEQKVRIGWEN